MNQRHVLASRRRQSGFATLILVLVVLVGLTAVTFYAGNSGLVKQRIAANEVRSKEAFQAAEIGTNLAINYVEENVRNITSWSWASCGNLTTLPCGDGTTNRFPGTVVGAGGYVYYVSGGTTTLPISDGLANYPNPAQGENPFQVHLVAKCADADEDGVCDGTAPSLSKDSLFMAIAQGWSADQTGTATTQQGFRVMRALAQAPDAPLIAVGGVDLSGSIEVVTNPNGGGPGVPLSAWTGGDVDIATGNAKTCYPGEYLDSGTPYADPDNSGVMLCDASGGGSCSCAAAVETGLISDSASLGEGVDIVDNINPFPDLFAYLFGVPRSSWQEVKKKATVLDNCDSLDANSSGFYWIEGNCHISANSVVGSVVAPVLLVVEDAELRMNGGATSYGLIYVFDADDNGTGAASSNSGTNQVYGALIAEGEVDITAGTFIVRYESTVLSNVLTDSSGSGVGRLPGTWLDYF